MHTYIYIYIKQVTHSCVCLQFWFWRPESAPWDQFGQVIKEGVVEDFANKEKIAKLLRFASTNSDSAEQRTSLEQYVERMAEDQEAIYYIVADTHAAAKGSPHLEMFRKKGIEVLLMSDRIDEWLVSHLNEFDGKALKSITSADLKEFEEEGGKFGM